MADEQQTEHQLPEPGLGDGEGKQDAIGISRVGGEGLVEGLVGLVELLIDELATDLVLLGQGLDRVPGQGVQSELLTWRRQPAAGGVGGRARLCGGGRGGSDAHGERILRSIAGDSQLPWMLRGPAFCSCAERPYQPAFCYPDLNQAGRNVFPLPNSLMPHGLTMPGKTATPGERKYPSKPHTGFRIWRSV